MARVYERAGPAPGPLGPSRQEEVLLLPCGTDGRLDFCIRGGDEHGIPIVVSSVEASGAAERAGLKVGHELLKVGASGLRTASHQQAVDTLTAAANAAANAAAAATTTTNACHAEEDSIALSTKSRAGPWKNERLSADTNKDRGAGRIDMIDRKCETKVTTASGCGGCEASTPKNTASGTYSDSITLTVRLNPLLREAFLTPGVQEPSKRRQRRLPSVPGTKATKDAAPAPNVRADLGAKHQRKQEQRQEQRQQDAKEAEPRERPSARDEQQQEQHQCVQQHALQQSQQQERRQEARDQQLPRLKDGQADGQLPRYEPKQSRQPNQYQQGQRREQEAQAPLRAAERRQAEGATDDASGMAGGEASSQSSSELRSAVSSSFPSRVGAEHSLASPSSAPVDPAARSTAARSAGTTQNMQDLLRQRAASQRKQKHHQQQQQEEQQECQPAATSTAGVHGEDCDDGGDDGYIHDVDKGASRATMRQGQQQQDHRKQRHMYKQQGGQDTPRRLVVSETQRTRARPSDLLTSTAHSISSKASAPNRSHSSSSSSNDTSKCGGDGGGRSSTSTGEGSSGARANGSSKHTPAPTQGRTPQYAATPRDRQAGERRRSGCSPSPRSPHSNLTSPSTLRLRERSSAAEQIRALTRWLSAEPEEKGEKGQRQEGLEAHVRRRGHGGGAGGGASPGSNHSTETTGRSLHSPNYPGSHRRRSKQQQQHYGPGTAGAGKAREGLQSPSSSPLSPPSSPALGSIIAASSASSAASSSPSLKSPRSQRDSFLYHPQRDHSRHHPLASAPHAAHRSTLDPQRPSYTSTPTRKASIRDAQVERANIGLPAPWKAMRDRTTNRIFFANPETKETTWVRPGEKSVVPNALDLVNWSMLPLGWERGTTSSGRHYYIDHNNQRNGWEHPRLLRQKKEVVTLSDTLIMLQLRLKEAEGALASVRTERAACDASMDKVRERKTAMVQSLASAGTSSEDIARAERQLELLTQEVRGYAADQDSLKERERSLEDTVRTATAVIAGAQALLEDIQAMTEIEGARSYRIAKECRAAVAELRDYILAAASALIAAHRKHPPGVMATEDADVWLAAEQEMQRLRDEKRQGGPWVHRFGESNVKTDAHMLFTTFIVTEILNKRAQCIMQAEEGAEGEEKREKVGGRVPRRDVATLHRKRLQRLLACNVPEGMGGLLQVLVRNCC